MLPPCTKCRPYRWSPGHARPRGGVTIQTNGFQRCTTCLLSWEFNGLLLFLSYMKSENRCFADCSRVYKLNLGRQMSVNYIPRIKQYLVIAFLNHISWHYRYWTHQCIFLNKLGITWCHQKGCGKSHAGSVICIRLN